MWAHSKEQCEKRRALGEVFSALGEGNSTPEATGFSHPQDPGVFGKSFRNKQTPDRLNTFFGHPCSKSLIGCSTWLSMELPSPRYIGMQAARHRDGPHIGVYPSYESAIVSQLTCIDVYVIFELAS